MTEKFKSAYCTSGNFQSVSVHERTVQLIEGEKYANVFFRLVFTLQVLCKQYASTEKIEVPKHFMGFLRTLSIALTIHARIMRIWFCPLQMFAIN